MCGFAGSRWGVGLHAADLVSCDFGGEFHWFAVDEGSGVGRELMADVGLPLLQQIGVVVDLLAAAQEGSGVLPLEGGEVQTTHDDGVFTAVLQKGSVEEDVGGGQAVAQEQFGVVPPVVSSHFPHDQLPQSLLHDVLALVLPLKGDLGGAVPPTAQTSDVDFALPLRLEHIVGCKADNFGLPGEEIFKTEDELVGGCVDGGQPEFEVDGVGLGVVGEVEQQLGGGVVLL